jgi:hypothetical protein
MARGMGPNVVRAVLMNASQLASYDWFKDLLIRDGHMKDGFGLHFTASFAAVSIFDDISIIVYLIFPIGNGRDECVIKCRDGLI